MKRMGVVGFALTVLLSVAAFADCGCGSAALPIEYVAFDSNEIVGFSLVVPGEYFWVYSTADTPLVTGWRVETSDGQVVRNVQFTEPRGHWESFLWDLIGNDGNVVPPGFYHLIIETQSVDSLAAGIEVLSCCQTHCMACCCACCTCTPVCWPPTPRGELYVELWNAGTRSCCGIGIHVSAEFVFSAP